MRGSFSAISIANHGPEATSGRRVRFANRWFAQRTLPNLFIREWPPPPPAFDEQARRHNQCGSCDDMPEFFRWDLSARRPFAETACEAIPRSASRASTFHKSPSEELKEAHQV